MRDPASSVVLLAILMTGTAVAKPLWPIGDDYLFAAPEISPQPQYLAAYQTAPSPYYIYNVHADLGVPGVFLNAAGKPEVSRLPAYSFYYGTPIYDLRIPLNPIYPVLTPSHPGLFPEHPILPLPPSSSTQRPFDEDDYDGVEKLDSKVERPSAGTTKPGNGGQDDDSITVEAI